MRIKGFIAAAVLALASLAGGLAFSAKPHGKIVLVGLTGLEDPHKVEAPYKHARIMAQTHRLEQVAVVVYGRAVKALSTKEKIPPEIDEQIKAAHAAGIPIFVCENALKKAGIALEDVRPEATPVPSGAAKTAELVSEGFTTLQY